MNLDVQNRHDQTIAAGDERGENKSTELPCVAMEEDTGDAHNIRNVLNVPKLLTQKWFIISCKSHLSFKKLGVCTK